jgi:putative membrane-bound dehydrogenase-like protein
MTTRVSLALIGAALGLALDPMSPARAADPLRVFIRAGVKTHGPGQHDHPRFLGDWTKLLTDRGCRVEGAMEFPSRAQLEATDVLVIFAADGMKIVGEQRADFEAFLRRGGGFVVIHDGVVSGDQHAWAKQIQGGAWVWENRQTKWYEGEVGLYVLDQEHPITRGLSNFDWKDEIYHDLSMAPEAKVLASSFHTPFVIAPQMWVYERALEGGTQPYRAFVSIPGHEYTSFNLPHYRAVLLRGIAWAAKLPNEDTFCRPEELASLKYPPGGPTAPEQAAQRLVAHPDFDLRLVASEPLVEKVISLDWDPKGRLWVAETPEYPGGRYVHRNDEPIFVERQRQPGAHPADTKESRAARDRISWLEDTDGDGRMDRKHVFATGLELVTSLVFHRDGVIVAQAPEIFWLRDRDGDGRCNMTDERVVLYTGFGTLDTHAVTSNMRWGMDGWIYSAVGYSAGHPKSGDGSKDFGRISAGIFRFKPDGSALEMVAAGSCNTWGLDFSWDNEIIYSTATCGEPILHVVVPEKVLARGNTGGVRTSNPIFDQNKVFPANKATRPVYLQIDWVGAFTAAAGSCVYNGGAWPTKWNNSHFVSETTVNLVHHEFLNRQGVTYQGRKEAGREEQEFLAGADLWFRPVHGRVGPDGAYYCVDFYNQAAVHNDTRGPRHGAYNAAVRPDRDHHFARLWRLHHKQATPLPPFNLDPNNVPALIQALEHPNGWVRSTAQRLLSETAIDKPLAALSR